MVRVLDKIKEMEEYATNYNVPIMMRDSINYINDRIISLKLYNILELGTAIAYSTINFATANENVKITSIERDENRYNKAVSNILECELNNKIRLVLGDALEVDLTDTYDLIIIDASKGKNIMFFEKYKNNLNDNGLIIIDNIKFHGLVGKSSEIKSKNLRRLVSKMEEFIEFLKLQEDYHVEFVDVGDGLAVCQKKKTNT